MINAADIQDLRQAGDALNGLAAPWCICGGWAIDLYLDNLTRPHKDVDIAIRRTDQILFQSHLVENGWRLEIAEHGLFPWNAAEYQEPPIDTIWCRNGERFLELLFNDWDDSLFRFKRKRSITMPSERSSFVSVSGYKVLAPEIVLLYKAGAIENIDYQLDFEHAYPQMSSDGQEWLREALVDLYGDHPWLRPR